MQALTGLAWLLALQSAGELLARGLALPFPGPVVGMVLLLAALQLPAVRAPVGACADFLLSHLSLLFVPVGVGVMTHLPLLGAYGGRMVVVIVASVWIGLAVTVLVLRVAQRPGQTNGAEQDHTTRRADEANEAAPAGKADGTSAAPPAATPP